MSFKFLLKNAGGFEQWRRAVTERADQLLTDDLLETENDDAPDPSLEIQRPACLKDNATTQEIALWEARERQYIVIHNRIQQLLEYMVQTLEPTLYERVVTAHKTSKRTPTWLYRAVKSTLNPSSKSAETDLQTRLSRLENSAMTTDIDIWLNSWIQIEVIAKASKYTWASEIIDRFHAALGHRSIFFATSFAAHIWLGSITLPQLAEQYRLCEAKLKRFDYIGAKDLENVFHPPIALATASKDKSNEDSQQNEKRENKCKCPCGIRGHSIQKCFLFNLDLRPNNWQDRRSEQTKKKLFKIMMDKVKRKQIEKELGRNVPRELLDNPDDISSSALTVQSDLDVHKDYISESYMTNVSSSQSSYMLTLSMAQSSLPYRNWWVFDSGSGQHICHEKALFHTFKVLKTNQIITTGSGNCRVEGIGSVVLKITTPKGPSTLEVKSVLYVPKFMVNIISMDRIKDQMLIWDHSENWLTRWDAERTPVVKIWNQYNQNFIARDADYPNVAKSITDIPETVSVDLVLNETSFVTKSSYLRKISSADVVIWHRRFGHPAPNTIGKLNNAVVGAKITGSYDGQCESCLLTKSKRIVSRIPVDKGRDYWTRMHIDLIVFPKAWNGAKYAVHAYDAKGHGHLVETLASKDQLTLCQSVINMIRKLQNEGRIIQYLHTDNEKGFGTKFRQMLKNEGIKLESTVPYTPEQNGFSESSGNRICTVARALRIHSGLPEELWPELVHSAVYLLNRTPTKGLNWDTPFEKYHGRKPDVSNIKIIGCRAYVHIPHQKRLASEKLAERAWIGYLIGFEAHNIWRIWHHTSKQVVRVRDVVFQEDRLFHEDIYITDTPIDINQFSNRVGSSEKDLLQPSLNRWNLIQDSAKQEQINPIKVELAEFNIPGDFSHPKLQDHKSSYQAPREHEISADIDERNIIQGKRTRRTDTSAAVYMEPADNYGIDSGLPFFSCLVSTITSERLDKKITRFDNLDDEYHLQSHHKSSTKINNPSSWKQMQKHHDRTQFMTAAHEEFQGLMDRQAWEIIDINDVPEKSQIFPMRWVFVTKNDSDGNLVKHKARIVIRGDLDKTSYNRDEIYSHTLGLQHFRSLMSYINYNDFETLSFDAVQAFINAKRDHPIYCYMPEGFRQRGKVLRVLQALYGHRQSPKDWFDCYTNELKALNFKSIEEEQCLWIHESGIILFFYVDDSIIAFPKSKEKTAINIQESLCKKFPIKKLGEAKSFLGLNVHRDREKRKMWLVQNGYIERIAKSYSLKPSGKVMSPLAPDYDMSPNTDTKLSADLIQIFQRKVGSAIYAAICTRPDIALAVSMCADHLVNPAMRHLNAITHILQYLVNTNHYGILYDQSKIDQEELNTDVLFMASDASFGDTTGRKSSQGFVSFLYGGPVVWHANKQRSVTTSTTEAELVALSAAARELMALERFLTFLTKNHDIHMTLLCDNSQTVKMLTQKTPLLTTKLRHIDVHQHWLREKLNSISNKNMKLVWVPTSKMPADGLTKRLHISKHQEFVRQIGLDDTSRLFLTSA